MVYQLPNGKVIQLTIAQYLDLTDEDIQYMTSINHGQYATSPWFGSTLSKKGKRQKIEKAEVIENNIDEDIDFVPENEEFENEPTLSTVESLFDEDFPELSDEDID